MTGRELLRAYLETAELSQSEFARRAGVHETTIVKILAGDRGPDLHTAIAIRDASSNEVPIESWPKPERKRREAEPHDDVDAPRHSSAGEVAR